jgi:hypothetical protein
VQAEPPQPLRRDDAAEERSLLIYWGSTEFYNDLAAHGSKVDVDAYVRDWQAKAAIYQQQSKKYWLYY